MMTETTIESRLLEQKERLRLAAVASGRDPTTIKLIAVSKRHESAMIRRAYVAGQRDFGENYVQELVAKAEELKDLTEIRWHMIGHLQSNKVKLVVGLVDCIHTISSVKLAHEVGRRARIYQERHGKSLQLRVLVEVNLSAEQSKSGCRLEEVAEILRTIDEYPSLRASGLMTIPRSSEDPLDARPQFDQLVQLRAQLGGIARLPELSMGMSQDAEVAVAAGASYVRIGQAIFGDRPSDE